MDAAGRPTIGDIVTYVGQREVRASSETWERRKGARYIVIDTAYDTKDNSAHCHAIGNAEPKGPWDARDYFFAEPANLQILQEATYEQDKPSVTIELQAGYPVCPIPDCKGKVVEQDTGSRWNDVFAERQADGSITISINQEYGDWESDGFACNTCGIEIVFTEDIYDLISYS